MWNARLGDTQAGIKILRRNIYSLRYADDRKWGRTKGPLDESERREWKSWLKLNIQKTKIMASGPITSWQIDGETMETETLFFGTPKSMQMVTAAMKLKDAWSLEEKLWST